MQVLPNITSLLPHINKMNKQYKLSIKQENMYVVLDGLNKALV